LSYRSVFCENAEARHMLLEATTTQSNDDHSFTFDSAMLNHSLSYHQSVLEQPVALMSKSDHDRPTVMWEIEPYALTSRSQYRVTEVMVPGTQQDHISSRSTVLLHDQLTNIESSLSNVETLVKSTWHAKYSSTSTMDVSALLQVQLEQVKTSAVISQSSDVRVHCKPDLGSTALFLPPPFTGDLQQDPRD